MYRLGLATSENKPQNTAPSRYLIVLAAFMGQSAGQSSVAARKTAGLTQEAVATRLRRSDGRKRFCLPSPPKIHCERANWSILGWAAAIMLQIVDTR